MEYYDTHPGEFGVVYKAQLTKWKERQSQLVAVKTLKGELMCSGI